MKIRNMLIAAATFASLAGGAGLANAPQGGLSVGAPLHKAMTHNVSRAEEDDDSLRETAVAKNPVRMTPSQRRAHRKNLGINFYRRDPGTVVADGK